MASYSAEQLALYLNHINYPRARHATDPLEFVTELQQHHLLRVPFESLSLHYSKDKEISLDPHKLFTKIVDKGRGGYCLENNTFFGEILRSLGFQVVGVVCRISNASRGIHDGGWRKMSHMAIVVHIGHTRYLVDVGYGADGPTFPIPLCSGQTSTDHPCQSVKLEYRNLPQHVDPNQRVWVYSKLTKSKTWLDIYHFIDAEFFAQDFLILNGHNMTRSFFADNVVVQRFIRTDTGSFASHILVRNTLKLRDDSTEEVLEVYQNEAQRIAGLERFFQIFLSSEEISSIQGSNSELVQA